MLVLSTRIMYCAYVVTFVVDQFKYNVKRLELFKIRRYIKSSLLLLLLYAQYIIRVDKTNIDYNNKGPKVRQSHGNNPEQYDKNVHKNLYK